MSLIDFDRGIPEPKITMGDDETAVQYTKILLAVIGIMGIGTILLHIHWDLLRMEQQEIKINQYLDNRLNYE